MSKSSRAGSRSAFARSRVVIGVLALVGVAAIGWLVLTHERPVPESETVEVVVAAKDLPVGTMIVRDDLKDDTVVKTKKVTKDGLPSAFVSNKEDLVDKRLSRPVRAGETFDPQDLSKGGSVSGLHDFGYDVVSLPLSTARAAAGFVGPGSRVNVVAIAQKDNKPHGFPLLVNLLVINVERRQYCWKDITMVGFAVTNNQEELLSLAKSRGCSLHLSLRNLSKSSEADKDYKIEKVFKFLNDLRETAPPPRPVREDR